MDASANVMFRVAIGRFGKIKVECSQNEAGRREVGGTRYKDYRIKVFELEPGLWRARVSRVDGYVIKTFPDDREYPWIETRGKERRSAGDAIEAAKKMIDDGGMH
jgi:hypothetical protein